MEAILLAVIAAIIGGVMRVLLGFFQAQDKFDLMKVGRSVGIAIILGIIAGISMPEFGFVPTLMATFAGTVAIENIYSGGKKLVNGGNEEKKKK